MYKLMNDKIILASSEAEIQYIPEQYGWQVGNTIIVDTERLFLVVKQVISVSPIEFMLLFTSPERVYIKSIRNTDPIVGDFMDIVEHPKLSLVNLALESTQQAVDYLLSKLAEAGIITPDQVAGRRAAILSGAFQ